MTDAGKCFCPQCQALLDGRLLIDDHVWLSRRCPRHGEVRTMLYHSPGYLAKALQVPRTASKRCVIVEVTARCDVGCDTCSASSIFGGVDDDKAVVVKRALDAATAASADAVAISGGEPLMRSDLWEIVDAIHAVVPKIVLITSGRAMENDPNIARQMAARASWLEIYLQFDSLRQPVLKKLRSPLVTPELRRTRLAIAVGSGAAVTTVCVVCPDGEPEDIGELATVARSAGAVGITFQPLRQLGRHPTLDACDGALATIDYIQNLALTALGVSNPAVSPLPQQPFDIAIANLSGDELSADLNFFVEHPRAGSFRVVTSSYWDATNYFSSLNLPSVCYFYSSVGHALNARYFPQSLALSRRMAHAPDASAA